MVAAKQMRISFRQILVVAAFFSSIANAYQYQWMLSRRNVWIKSSLQSIVHLSMKPNTGNIGNDGDATNDFDVEATRQKLESLVSKDKSDKETATPKSTLRSKNQSLYASLSLTPIREAPLLTSMERERREAEIKVLQRLERGDEAMHDLWTLWFQERGVVAAKRLEQGEELASQPTTWTQAEAVYRELIAQYGVHWAEPVNKLATLYFLQGRLQESAALCKIVLAVKPWHFGALSGIVAVYIGLQDMEKAKHWAAARMPQLSPPGSPNNRREEWVQKAVSEANQSLVAAERQLKASFGRQDHDVTEENNRYCNELDDKESWQ